MTAAAVQSNAIPATAIPGHIDVDDGLDFDPFDEVQEHYELQELRTRQESRGLRRSDAAWY